MKTLLPIGRKLKPYLLLLPLLLLLAILLWGIVSGISQSFGVIPAFDMFVPTAKYYKEVLTDSSFLECLVLSLRVAVISSLLSLVLGVFLCHCVVAGKAGASALYQGIKVPILVPHTVVAILVINMLSSGGVIARFFYFLGWQQGADWMENILYTESGWGIVLGYVWKEAPFVCFFLFALMAGIDERLGEAATNLGAGSGKTFFTVTLPLCRSSILGAFIIIFTYSFGAYELPFLLGSTLPKALPVQAYVEYVHPDLLHRPYAMALNGIILFFCLIITITCFLLMKKYVYRINGEEV